MKPTALAALLLVASVASAQKKPLAPAPLPQKGEGSSAPARRIDAIMDFANDRMSTEIDVLFDDGDFPAVIGLLKVQAEQYPADYDVWTNLGWMQENVEQWDAALATYVRYKRQNPTDPDAALPEANFYFMRKVYAKVPPLMEPAIKGGKTHANAYRILAKSYERQGMLGDALRVYKSLVARDPDDGAAKANVRRVEDKIEKGK